jgi:glycosyltransferase involved in cell wall biosynthesis
MTTTLRVAVAIPCYKVTQHVLNVIAAIGPEVEIIYAVDDGCPDGSGRFIEKNNHDPRVQVLYHPENLGVGGAVSSAYKAAIAARIDVVVKIDGDGQMNPALLPLFIRPIARGRADYTKGNRFYRPESLRGMPYIRLLGNAALSFLNKLSSGYWPIMDPTNGYTAIHTAVLRKLPLEKLERGYFFETDMLYQLNTIRAVVHDVPMDAVYAEEESNLKVFKVLPEFLCKHIARVFKRYIYLYLLRDFNIGSVYSIFGVLLCMVGSIFGGSHWWQSAVTGQTASSGTVMLAALPLIIGIQFLIAFLHYDVSNVPRMALSPDIADWAPQFSGHIQ